MNRPSKLLLLLAAIASASNPVMASQPNNANSMASSLYNERLQEMLSTTGWHFESAMDTKQIAKEFRANQARAQTQFSKPGIYHGRISKVVADSLGTNFIVDQGQDTAVTVLLDKYQAWPWKTTASKAEVGGVQSALEFAANFNPNQEMYFQCRRVEFGLGIYLTNCLAFPRAVASTKFPPEPPRGIDPVANFEELIKARASEGWARPSSTQSNMSVTLEIIISIDGSITSVNISRSSGNTAYDKSVVAAIKNIGALPEMQGINSSKLEQYHSFKMSLTPADLAL
ncbi:energy transducer TonB [Pseudomonas moraviensis]|uniref:energy transducer TonB n=1 Tax=Pseudomonas moraviensis TaxID=321662 RepID=UPI00080E0B29|nr:energy transducer TonB [Pseudomonas moraviensis]